MLRNIVRKTGRSVGLWRQYFRKLGVVAALGLALALLAACGSDAEATPQPEAQPTTIVDIAVGDDRFQTLVAALQAADLVETLQGEGPFTVFAPTDDAFAKLPEGTVDALLKDIAALTDILLYHVMSGNVMAADVVKLDMATTVQGEMVTVTVDGDTVRINDAQVVITDIQASNGTIHAIDTVLVPPQN